MERRVALQSELESILGSREVYYQPPSSIKLKYPSIVYALDDVRAAHADNMAWRLMRRYSVTLITRNPDDPTIDKLGAMPMCNFSRYFSNDNLHHYNYSIYY